MKPRLSASSGDVEVQRVRTRDARTADVLAGGGEMGARVRSFDWSQTPLGPSDHWPQSLKRAISIMLPSKAQIVLFWGPDLIAIYNDAYSPTFGGKHPWALGQPARECWSEVWHVLGPLFEGVVRTGEAFWAKEHPFFLQRQGFLEETYYDVSYDPVRIEDGTVGGIFCIVSDQTGRVLGERRLRTLKELGTRTADAKTAEAVCGEAAAALASDPADVPFSLLYLFDGSAVSARLVGAAGIELSDLAFGHEITVADVECLASARAGRTTEVDTTTFVRRMPESAADRVVVLPISAGTQIVGALVAGASRFLRLAGDYRDFFDLAAARISAAIANARAYEEERRRAEALAELDRVKTRFFSNVSHEFRTPLTLMIGPVEEARQDADMTPANRERLELIHRSALRLLKLVNTLLDFSRIEAGRIDAVYEPIDLATYTAELASNFRAAIEKAGMGLVVDCPTLPEPVYVDREMWEKVVLNLLSNAFKHTFEGEIAIRVRNADRWARVEVADTGVGMAADQLPHLFERFHRVPNARSRTHEGTGIGLALVQEILNLHGGRIDVTSREGGGTTFTVSLPFGAAHLPADRIGGVRQRASTVVGAAAYAEEALRWLPSAGGASLFPIADAAQEATPVGSVVRTAGARILLADDNADIREYVGRLLRAQGWSVEAVADGRTALECAVAEQPDLVLADVMMPVLDGFALLRTLREDPSTSAIPVVLLSARAGEESRIEGLEAGADDYVVKPFSARELTARVAAALERKRAEAALRYHHAQIETLINTAPLGVYLVDGDLRIREVNPIALPVFGDAGGSGGVVGRDFDEIIHLLWGKEYADEIVRIFRHTLETGESYVTSERAEFRIDRGITEYYEWRLDRITLPDGRYGVVCYFRDISPQVRAREAIAASEARYRTLYESIDEGFCVIEVLFDDNDRPVDYRFLETNPAFAGQTGLTDAVGRTIREIVPGHEAHWFEIYGRIARTGESERFVNEAKMLNRWYDVYAFRVGMPGERKVAILFNDITARRHTEGALRASEERYRNLVENVTGYAIFLLDEHGNVTEWTRGATQVEGYTAEEIIGKHISVFYTPEDVAAAEPHRELDEAARTGRAEREGWRVRKGGERFWVNEIANAVRDDDGRLLGFTTIARDMTERRMAEASAERARTEAEREALRRRLSQTEEDERRRLARELHDEAGQHLTALSLGLQALSDVTPAGSEADRRATHLRSLASTLGKELHSLALRLRPKALDEFGLEPALSVYAEEWGRQSGIAIDIHAHLGVDRLPTAIESAVYRIVQEALTNVTKHSGAGRASIHVERRDELVIAIIEDNGRGFDPGLVDEASYAERPPTLGLLGIRERAALLGGAVEIESAPGQGTTLFVQIPVAVPRSERKDTADDVRTPN